MKDKIILIAAAALAAFVGLYIIYNMVTPGENEMTAEKTEEAGTYAEAGTDAGDEDAEDAPITFQTIDLDENEVTQDIFSDYDLTVVHVWGTFCGPCIVEMPDYGKLGRELPENVNLVGLVCDVYDDSDWNVDEAKGILKDCEADFLNLRMNDEMDAIIAELQYVPSSFFVDREGKLVGDMLEGEGIEETIKQLNKYME